MTEVECMAAAQGKALVPRTIIFVLLNKNNFLDTKPNSLDAAILRAPLG